MIVDDYIKEFNHKVFIMLVAGISIGIISFQGVEMYWQHILVLCGVWVIGKADKKRIIDHAALEGIDLEKEIVKRNDN
jgi:predicted RNA-binding protein with PUA domain